MEGVVTRYNLLKLKRERTAFLTGVEIIKKRREALAREFIGLTERYLSERRELSNLIETAERRFQLTKALAPEAVESFGNVSKRRVLLEMTVKNVWGVNIPEIEAMPVVRTLETRDISPIGERAGLVDAAKDFENAVHRIIKFSTVDSRLSSIGDMIRSDTRKINSIEEVSLPRMKKQIDSMERTLEEREKEEKFRLKRHKRKRLSLKGWGIGGEL